MAQLYADGGTTTEIRTLIRECATFPGNPLIVDLAADQWFYSGTIPEQLGNPKTAGRARGKSMKRFCAASFV